MASAATVQPGACLYALDATADRAFQIAGAQSVYTACGVVVESSASDGFEMEGSETLYLENHAQVSVVGGAQLNGQTYLYDTISGKDVQAVQVSSPGDPLASIAPPTSGTIVGKSPTYYDMNSKLANNTISPGVYCGGLTIGNTDGAAFTMSPGVYIMAGGGLVFNSQAVVTGTGVTVYNTSSTGWGCASSYNYKPVTISGQVTATLSAPTSGALNGILFFGNRTGCSTKGSCVDQINGGSTTVLNGALYFASDEIEITGSNASGFMMLVADKIYINGNSNFGNNGDPFDNITVSVSPATTLLYASQTQQFTATVTNTANPAVTWTISPAGVGNISSTGLYTAPSIITTPQTVTVTATSQADDTKSSTATVTLEVTKTTPVITWATPAAITYGTALSATQLDATASVSGTFVYTPAASTVLPPGSQTLSVTFTPTNTVNYNSATDSVSLTVNQAALTITASSPTVSYGAPVPTITPSYSGWVSGQNSSSLTTQPTCTTAYTVISAAGSSPATSCSGAVDANYAISYVPGTVTVTQVAPALSVASSSNPSTYGGSVTFTATISSGPAGSVNFYDGSTLLGSGPISGTTATYSTASLAAGAHSITAEWAGSTNYGAVTSSPITQTVNQAALTITASSASVSYGSAVPVIAPSYSGFVNGDSAASLTIAPICSTTYTVSSAPGTYPTTCSGAVDANYNIGYIAGTITVATGSQTISFTPPVTPVNYGVQPIALSATASSGLTVTFKVLSGPAVVIGNILTITGPGTAVVAADQAGNTDYTAAAEVTQTIVVNLAPSYTELTSSLNPSTYGQSVTFNALVSTGGVSPTGNLSFNDAGATINSTTVTPIQTTNLVAYSQANATAWTSDETGSAAPIVSANSGLDPFGGTNALQMAFPTPGVGTSDSFNTVNVSGTFAGQTFTASVWLSAPSATSINLLLNEVGGSNASASYAVTVGTAWQRYFVSLPIPAADTGASSLNLVLVNPSGQPAVTINVFGAQVENAVSEGPYVATYGTALSGYGAIASFATSTLTPGSHPINAAYAGDSNDAASASVTLAQVVNDATPSLSLASSANSVIYSAPVTFTAIISNSLTGNVTFYDGSTAIGTGALSAGSATLTTSALSAGSHAITAAWAGNADYNPVTSTTVTQVVSQATPAITWQTPAPIIYGTALSATQLNASSPVAGIFVYNPAAGTVLPAGVQTLSVTFTPTDSIDYTPAMANVPLTVTPAQCISNGYSYQRAITIDHTKVPNTDQVNFPFLFSTTDQAFATIANNGHVANPNGYDIVFSADPNGLTKLDYELEQYNPATGQIVAWVRIPTLAHTSDTVIYVFYGNASVSTSQQNPTGVWDKNYLDVLHLDEISGTTVYDSTANGNNGTKVSQSSPTSVSTGEIGGAQSFNGTSDFIALPPSMTSGLTVFSASFWANTIDSGSNGTYWNRPQFLGDSTAGGSSGDFGVNTNSGYLGMWSGLNGASDNSLVSSDFVGNGKWHRIDAVNNGSVITLYLDGQNTGQTLSSGLAIDSYGWYLGAQHYYTGGAEFFHQGSLDEFRFSNSVRSADWIATEYNNQSSPSTFYTLYAENAVGVVPATAYLYAGQSQQFTALGACGAAIAWSMPSGAQGTLSASGFYTAPASIASQQKVTITASSQPGSTAIGSGIVTLMPPPTLTLTAAAHPPYVTGSSQGFVVTLKDVTGTPQSGAAITFIAAGANSNTNSGVTDSNGIASFAYIGANSGNDTVQATATFNGQQLTSNSVSVSWNSPVPTNAEGSVTLKAGVNLGLTGLCGAFTDGNGSVIEPIAIGTSPRVSVVPAGATQLQLGVVDDRYGDNTGSGFAVEVNGVITTVLPTTMPWLWASGGLNNNYKYGILDGTNPIIALTGLTQGSEISIAYQSGTVSAGWGWPYVNADGDPQAITGVVTGSTGTYFPTLYMLSSNYPIGQPISITAVVSNSSESPLANVPVLLNVTGANAHQYQTTTDSTGTASFTYIGINAGNDIIQAKAYLTGEADLVSSQSSVTWAGSTNLPPSGTLTLTPNAIQPLPAGGQQAFTVYATDAAGNAAANIKLEMSISGVDNINLFGTTDSTGHASFVYQDINPGVASVIVSGFIDGLIAYSDTVSVPWTLPTITSGGGGTISISITAPSVITLPNTMQLSSTATDTAANNIQLTWSMFSGPGTVTFTPLQQEVTTQQQVNTTAKFSQAGAYVLLLSATDNISIPATAKFSVTVDPVSGTDQGWIGSPLNGSAVSGIVPITLASGITLQSGTLNPPNTLNYYPANNPNNITTLPITAQSGTIAMLDTTTLANGSYWIQLQATDTNGDQQYALVLVTVAGNYKPGRVTATVTDLVVPSTGLAINIQRIYDSLNAGTSGDFGYGWNLGINVNLTVDNVGNVTFTLGGQRKTFYLAPQYGGWLFPYYFVAYTPEPGLHGTLTDIGSSCGAVFDMVVPDGNLWYCFGTGAQFNTTGYVYTDPNGTSYSISATGNLQSIQDRSGNGLTITANGINSTTGLSVPFVRDSSNRITQITDPQGNIYSYGYDGNGNLATVTYPATSQSATCPNTSAPNTSTYTYDQNHLYLSGTDGRCNPLPVTTYYDSTNDGGNSALDGRMASVTDAFNNTTSYTYILSTTSTINGVRVPNTGVTTITYPDSTSSNVDQATMIYDSYGMLLSSTDPLGNTTINVYDANHNLISTTDPLGHTTTSTYDTNGNKTSSTYPASSTSKNTTSYTYYNQYSEPISTTDELGNVRTFNYDANYNPQSVTDSIGTLASFIFNSNQTLAAGAIGYDISVNPAMASQFTYDANGNMTSRTDALGRTTTYTYNSLGQKTSMVTPTPASPTGGSGSTTIYTYDALGNLTQTAAPLNRTTSATYDANGNKTSSTDALGNVTNYQYDALNRLIETDYPSNATTPVTKSTKSYDFRNNVIDEIDQAGNVTHHEYDMAGRQTKVTRGYGSSTPSATTYEYDNASRKISETDANSNTTNYTYDADNRLTAISGVAGNFIYAYDDAGNRISSTDGKDHKTSYQYDARKRLIETDYPDGTSVKNTYDGPGNLASVTDQAENVVNYTYDAANQLATVVQHNSPIQSDLTNSYGYDPLGNLIGLTDARSNKTVNGFNVFNEPIQKILPDQTHTETRTYDAAGNLVSLTHFNGVTTTYTYDALNRLLTRSTPGEATVSFTYTATGKYHTSAVGSHTTSYAYDSLDRLTAKATPQGTLSYTYYANGQVETIKSSNPGGASVAYTYDPLNRLSSVVDNNLPGGQNTTNYTYDPASNVATVVYPNGLTSTFTYDSMNRLTELSTPPVADYKYTLGLTGNRTNATEQSGRALTWNYDNIYRLTNETITDDPANNNGNNGSATYTLDPVGNRTSANSTFSGFSPVAGSYNADDQLSSESYDANGNTTLAANGNSYTYDSENHMTSATGNGKTITMAYDAFGNRVAKTVNGVTTWYLVEDDVNPTGLPQVMEEKVGGAVERVYTYGLQRISQYQFFDNQWTASFYVYDGAGSVRQLTDSNGTPTDEYEYDAYGNSFTKQGTTPNNYLYRGEQFDSDLGLYYLRARYYNPATGRFLSRDPEEGNAFDPKTLHKYDYAGGDPVNAKDPTGRNEAVEEGIDLGVVIVKAVVATVVLTAAIACAYEWIDTNFISNVNNGLFYYNQGSVFQTGPCRWKLKPPKPHCTLGGASETVVIGEGMRTRVVPYALLIQGGYYPGLPADMSDSFMSDNMLWINEAMDQECKIVDIGPDGRPIPSPYYMMEKQQIAARAYPYYYPIPYAP